MVVGTSPIQIGDVEMKGLFFSLIILILTMIFISFILLQKSLVSFYSKQTFVEARVDWMLNFYDSILKDSEKAFKIIGRRALSAAINKVIATGIPLNSSNSTVYELIFNGTLNGEPQPLLQGSTLTDWKNKLKSIAAKQALELNISFNRILIYPYDSFNVKIEYEINVYLHDLKINASLNKSKPKEVLINIENLEDPLYPLKTYGRIVNTFRLSPHWLNYSANDTTNLLDDLKNSYYHPSLKGGSIFDRLEGKCEVQPKYQISKNYIGLESFVNKDEILSSGLDINVEASNVDYIYFCNPAVQAFKVQGMPSNFRLDNETTVYELTHLQIYNVSVVE